MIKLWFSPPKEPEIPYDKDITVYWVSSGSNGSYGYNEIQAVLKAHSNYQTAKLGFDFRYAVEQTLSAFLQAAVEAKLNTRQLQWESWQPTFKALDVADVAQKLWPRWLELLENPQNFDKWLAQSLNDRL